MGITVLRRPHGPAPTPVTERRAVRRVLQHWRAICGARAFPSRRDIEPLALGSDWPNCFTIELMGHRGPSFTFIGEALRIPAWGEGTGCRVGDLPPGTILFVATDYVENVLQNRLPVTHSGAAMHAGAVVLFRSVLLPLSEDGRTITGLLGTVNYRRVEENRLVIVDED